MVDFAIHAVFELLADTAGGLGDIRRSRLVDFSTIGTGLGFVLFLVVLEPVDGLGDRDIVER